MRSFSRKKIALLIILFITFVLEVTMSVMVALLGVLPTKFLALLIGSFLLFDILHAIFVIKEIKVTMWIFTGLSVAMSGALIWALVAIGQVNSTLKDIQEAETTETYTERVLITTNESGLDSIESLAGLNVGLTDDNASKEAAIEINKLLDSNKKPSYAEYPETQGLIDALLAGSEDACIVDGGYLSLLEDMDEYACLKTLETYEIAESAEEVVFQFARTVSEDELVALTDADEASEGAEDDELVYTDEEAAAKAQTTTSSGNGNNFMERVNEYIYTGGIANSKTGAHTSYLDFTNDVITAGDGCFIAYISGIDTTGSVSVCKRSDVNILAIVNTNTGNMMLIDTPRDYFVILPQVNKADKLTHAGLYGVNASIGALEHLYGIKINYYMKMNFTGFVQIIDTLGGIDVYSDYNFTVEPVKTYEVGWNHLTGVEALAFARERKVFSSGDIQRGKNQMAVIKAMVNKMTTPEVLYNYSSILASISSSMTTDMPTDTIYSLVNNQLARGTAWNISSMTAGGYGASSTTYSIPSAYAYVMTPNDDDVLNAHNLIRSTLGQ